MAVTTSTRESGLLDTREAAHFLGVQRVTLQTWRTKGRGPAYIKIGHRVFYRETELWDFLSRNEKDPRDKKKVTDKL